MKVNGYTIPVNLDNLQLYCDYFIIQTWKGEKFGFIFYDPMSQLQSCYKRDYIKTVFYKLVGIHSITLDIKDDETVGFNVIWNEITESRIHCDHGVSLAFADEDLDINFIYFFSVDPDRLSGFMLPTNDRQAIIDKLVKDELPMVCIDHLRKELHKRDMAIV